MRLCFLCFQKEQDSRAKLADLLGISLAETRGKVKALEQPTSEAVLSVVLDANVIIEAYELGVKQIRSWIGLILTVISVVSTSRSKVFGRTWETPIQSICLP